MITQFAPAKLNLCLHITGRRDGDNYHLLDSFIVFTGFGDTIRISPAPAAMLSVTGTQKHAMTGALLSTQADSPNLIIRALHAMSRATGKAPDIHIELDKNIPAGAGLGGGSSDAAATMSALNALWGNPLTDDDMAEIGLTLGTELPVCLAQQAAQVCGVGDITKPVPHLPSFPVLIIWPDTPLLTAQVFQHYRATATGFDTPLSALPDNNDKNAWIDYLSQTTNGLTETAMALCPDVKDILEKLNKQKGCRLARMSGSGSACFGIFDDQDALNAAAMAFGGYHTAATHIL